MPLATRRPPGIRFETQPPQPTQVLPRMDVASFVGFASCGPLDVPVPVQDATQFEAVFGPDAPLAWNPARGTEVHAALGPAVRTFFANGGRRCWIVRVASRGGGAPARDRFPLGGVLAIAGNGAPTGQATLAARAAGSWADAVSVTAAVDRAPLQLLSVHQDPGAAAPTCTVLSPRPGDLRAGDLVRVAFLATTWTMLFGVDTVTAAVASPPDPLPQPVVLTSRGAIWVRIAATPPAGPGTVTYLGPRCAQPTVTGTLAAGSSGAGTVAVTLATTVAQAPPAGSLVSGTFSGAAIWIYVEDVELSADGTGTLLTGLALELSTTTPAPAPWTETPAAVGELLTLSIRADGGSEPAMLDGLGFLPGHPRFLGALPIDEALYADPADPPVPGTLAADAAVPRFPLAADPASTAAWYLPVTEGLVFPPALPALPPPGSERARDGLAQFDADCFVDPSLAGSAVMTLLADAQAIRDLSTTSRPLEGMHALLSIDEVTIVALPDVIHRGWLNVDSSDGTMPATSTEPAEPAPPPPDWSEFLRCGTVTPSAPALSLVGGQAIGTFSLSWTASDAPGPSHELEQATLADMSDAVTIYEGPAREFSLYGRPPGATLRFRVRASSGGNTGGWSPTLVVAVPAPDRWLTIPTTAFDGAPLLATQLAALRMCAARGDMLAVLALPEHYRTREATAHIAALRTSTDGAAETICGYGALYHPWVWVTNPADPGVVTPVAPDGAATGVIAARSYSRGPWVAPANEALTGVVALDPPLPVADRQTLLDAQLNVVRDDAEGFRWLAADTLTEAADVRPINVRRLIQALCRYATLRGAAYVFEPDSDAFRRGVEHDLEQLLTGIWALGAFAGATPSESFRVSTGNPPNSSASIDAGEVIAEVGVAPSLPLVFLTVRLIRGADGGLTAQVA